MATGRKRWPNHAEWARMDALAVAERGRRALVASAEGIDSPEILRAILRAVEAFREIENKLREVG